MKKAALCLLVALSLLFQCLSGFALAADSSTQATVSVNSGSLNMRSSAGTGAPIIRSLINGTSVTVLSRSGDWCYVRAAGTTGYVHGNYLRYASQGNSSTGSSAGMVGSGTTAYVATLSGKLNMRSSASVNSPVIHRLAKDTMVSVLSQSGGWSYIRADGRTGYVLSSYLRTRSSSGSSSSAGVAGSPSTGSTAYVNTSSGSLNLRDAAGSFGRIIGSLPRGSEVTILSYSGDWARVSSGTRNGYVNSNYLSSTAPSGSGSASSSIYNQTVAYTTYAQVLRAQASDSAASITDLSAGEACTIVSYGSIWSYVNAGGRTGYLRTAGLRLTQESASSSSQSNGAITSTTSSRYTAKLSSGMTIRVYGRPTLDYSDYIYMLTVPSGNTLSVTQHATTTDGSTWANIHYSGIAGWVLTNEITAVSTVQTQPSTQSPTQSYGNSVGLAYVQTGGAYLRGEANGSAYVLATLPAGTPVSLYTAPNGFYQTSYDGTQGYISSASITFTAPVTQQQTGPSIDQVIASQQQQQQQQQQQDFFYQPSIEQVLASLQGTSSQPAAGSSSGPSIEMILASLQR